ncbi:CD151 antigen-like [Ruditapes philippinarum]|uniref:CD151 antigen-like n=1 Tax=Ruditapes philippinarum TaxID=129788 RepID=UPI00295A70A7|nr:CD151 antigen-like [Ruditapes philippinarum]
MWSKDIDELGMINQSEKGSTCARVFKIILITFMCGLMVGGVAVLGIGIWAHESEYGSKAVGGLIGVALYSIDSTLFIACGSVTICIMGVGLIGYLLPQKCLLGLHLCVMTFLAFTLFAAGILGYVFVGELEDTVRGSLKKSVTEKYGTPGKESITRAWDDIQQAFDCCGGYGGENTTTSWYLYQSESFWFKDNYNNNASVPESCCKRTGDVEMCMGLKPDAANNFPPYRKPPITALSSNYTIYLEGCYDKLEKYLEQNGILIGTTAVVMGVFMIIEIAMTIFVYRSLH